MLATSSVPGARPKHMSSSVGSSGCSGAAQLPARLERCAHLHKATVFVEDAIDK